VAAVSGGDRWLQVYVWRDRGLLREMIARARAAGYSTLLLTVDTAVLGRRDRDVRRGFSLPPRIGPATLVDGVLHPGWTWAFVRSEPIRFANVVGRSVGDGADPVSLATYINARAPSRTSTLPSWRTEPPLSGAPGDETAAVDGAPRDCAEYKY
jgi:L-lactate dehydrogenase (cytochrome)